MLTIFNYPTNSLDSVNLNFEHFLILTLIFLSIGSFVSTLIYRLSPSNNFSNYEIITFRSHCDYCNKSISIMNLLPLIGFIKQYGKCINCNEKISIVYPITEIVFFFIGFAFVLTYGLSVYSVYMISIFSLFYILFFLDLKYFFLPIAINILIPVIGLTGNIFFSLALDESIILFNISPAMFSIIGFLAAYFFLWLINFLFKLIKGFDGMGGGDFILFGGIGSIFGPLSLGPILFISSILGIFYFIFSAKNRKSKIPFGSCLTFATIIFYLHNILNF